MLELDLQNIIWMSVVVVLSFSLLRAPEARAQSYGIRCTPNGETSDVNSSTLPFTRSCGGTPWGFDINDSYSGSATISFSPDGTEIDMGSQMNWNGFGPSGGFDMDVGLSGILVSNTLPGGTPVQLKGYFAGEGTHGTGPYGGTYSFNFSPGSFDFSLNYTTSLTINGTTVLPTDFDAQTLVCYPPPGLGCIVTTGFGSGTVLHLPRMGIYSAYVGQTLNVAATYYNYWQYAVGTSGTFSYNLEPGLTFAAADPTTGAPISGLSIVLSDGTVIPVGGGVTYSCAGFQSPFNVALSLTKANRAIPLKAQLFDSNGNLVTPATLGTAAPPVVNVSYTSGTSTAVDETSQLDPLGQSSVGNQFNFDPTTETWWFNLASTPFTASGTYTVKMQSGDTSKYNLSPQCSGKFVKQ